MTNTELPHPQKCALYHDLWTDRSWVHRRIDEISFTERGMMQVKSTFDLDIAYLRKRIIDLPEELRRDDQIALPLMALPRTLLLDIDVTLDGKAQSFASTETSADITRCIYLQEYFSKRKKDLSINEWPPECLDEMEYVSEFICHWLEQSSSEDARKWLQNTDQTDEIKEKIMTLDREETEGKCISQNDIDTLYEELKSCDKTLSIIDNITNSDYPEDTTTKPYQWEQWSRFSKDYIAVVLIDIPSGRRRAKLTYITKTNPNYSNISNILSIRTSLITVACASLLGSGVEKRYHFRINAPDGHYISSLGLVDARNDNNEVAFHQSNVSSQRDSYDSTNKAQSVACVTADGANLTFLEIKDNTLQGRGNIFGYTLNIGVEPFPRTFMTRACLGIVFLLVYLLISRFMTFKIESTVPFNIAALGFLASSPLWFRIGSEDAFTHRTLKRGRSILVGLAFFVFIISFANHLVNGKIRFREANGDPVKCSFVLDEHAQIFDEHYICSIGSFFSSPKVQNILDNFWELCVLSCLLYLLGTVRFFIRTHIQEENFKIFLEQINDIVLVESAIRFDRAKRLLFHSVQFLIGFIILLLFESVLFVVLNCINFEAYSVAENIGKLLDLLYIIFFFILKLIQRSQT